MSLEDLLGALTAARSRTHLTRRTDMEDLLYNVSHGVVGIALPQAQAVRARKILRDVGQLLELATQLDMQEVHGVPTGTGPWIGVDLRALMGPIGKALNNDLRDFQKGLLATLRPGASTPDRDDADLFE